MVGKEFVAYHLVLTGNYTILIITYDSKGVHQAPEARVRDRKTWVKTSLGGRVLGHNFSFLLQTTSSELQGETEREL